MKYRLKPEITEAVQFTRNNFEEIMQFTNGEVSNLRIEKHINGKAYCDLKILDFIMPVIEGNYIVKTEAGGFFVVHAEVIEKYYEKVE